MRSTLFRYAELLLYTSMATAQDTRTLIIPSSGSSAFPACAVGCAVLQQSQTNCQPSADTQLNFENCFCQSPTLAGLYSSPDLICTAECPNPPDRALLQTWYSSFCRQVGQGIDPLTVAPAAPSTTMVTVTSTSSSNPGPTITGSGSNQAASTKDEGSWISNHWQWILMLGILAIGFGLIAWGAIWLKKRHQRRVDERRAALSGFPTENEKRRDGARAATPDLWGPHQHMHATKGWEYHEEEASTVPSSSGGLSTFDKHGRSTSKREIGPRSQALRDSTMSETGVSRKKSSKGKQKDVDSIEKRDPSQRGSRSRSHGRRDRDNG